MTPLIEESETLDVQNAEAVYQELADVFGPTYQVGLLHGRMANQEKEQVMAEFKANQFQVLVSTTVIEVGVDVPNASVMLILDADRFGLSQLHQLRGRVGRGERQSYNFLVSDPKTQYGIERMEVMTQTTDGLCLHRRILSYVGQVISWASVSLVYRSLKLAIQSMIENDDHCSRRSNRHGRQTGLGPRS
ncbi:ATP-dependent DNA helicase recG [Weissella viridescens]|uniref:ATP-dependent DNA helicase recG n=1 Tax=Weissella viridescens TaxID=1629 RepID=A0A380P9H5_WEIVI|nr:ATP-dependent DNA helicase recG [Weissella viridescens]